MGLTREHIRRTGATVAALAAAAGIVFLMRTVARTFADGTVTGSASGAGEVEPDRMPAPKTYDLAKLVPADLRLTLGGVEATVERKTVAMPLELAIKTGEAEARAAGWETMSMPLAYQISTLLEFGDVYVTPDRRFVRRRHTALASGETLREDFYFPAGPFLSIRRDMTLDEVVALRADAVCAKLPAVLRAVQVAKILYTQYNTHRGGASLIVVGLSSWDERAVRAQLVSTFRRAGWRPDADEVRIWTKENLSASWDVSPREEGSGTVVSVRYSDDEVILSRKENEE